MLKPVGLTKRASKRQGKVMRKSTGEKTKGTTKTRMESTMLNPSAGRKENPGPSASVSP